MTDVEKSEFSPHLEEFQIFHKTDVEKSEIMPNLEEFQIWRNFRCKEFLKFTMFFIVNLFVAIHPVFR